MKTKNQHPPPDRFTSSPPPPLLKVMCATCPFRPGSPYAHLRPMLEAAALVTGRICHSTGRGNAIHRRTGQPEKLCRGARDFQLAYFLRIGFLAEPTDACWAAKWQEVSGQQKIPGPANSAGPGTHKPKTSETWPMIYFLARPKLCYPVASVDCREIVTPRRVDPEQMTGVDNRQPEGTRDQKQADAGRASMTARPCGLGNQPDDCNPRARPRTGARSGSRIANPSPITGEAFCTRTHPVPGSS